MPEETIRAMKFPDFNWGTFLTLWLAPLLCFAAAGILLWWGWLR